MTPLARLSAALDNPILAALAWLAALAFAATPWALAAMLVAGAVR